jgi:hypothetical protein
MNAQARTRSSRWLVRSTLVAGLCLGGAISLLAFADGPTQPDPPVPLERATHAVALSAERDLDCRCAVLHARDIESRVEGHVERWEALSRAAQARSAAMRRGSASVHLTSLVEGVVGFPVRQFRLAADDPDDGAGSD